MDTKLAALIGIVILAAAIAVSLEAINPHRSKNSQINPWIAGIVWFVYFAFQFFLVTGPHR